jgi:hypothetical protein
MDRMKAKRQQPVTQLLIASIDALMICFDRAREIAMPARFGFKI